MINPILVKLGGSLLQWSELSRTLDQFISGFHNPLAILVGGGILADYLRDWHKTQKSTEESSHWRATKVMDLTSEMLRDLNPRFRAWSGAFPPWSESPPKQMIWVIQPSRWLEYAAINGSDTLIPRNWSTSSDSIALKLASDWRCSRLLLLKSCDRPSTVWEECARTGHIDPAFPLIIKTINPVPEIEWINLRNFEPATATP